jgi:cytochrome c biogenesis protein CcmG/thiol:disulfide interchange protein DsbE
MNSNLLKRFMPLIVFISLVVLLAIGLGLDPKKIPSALIGQTAPRLDLPQLYRHDKLITNEQLLGQVWLLNVWASWCTACLAEHTVLNKFSTSKRAPLIGLNYKDDAWQAKQWLIKHGNPYQLIAFDAVGRAGIDWGVYGVPETFVVDQQGIIRYKHIGPLDEATMQATILPLIDTLNHPPS